MMLGWPPQMFSELSMATVDASRPMSVVRELELEHWQQVCGMILYTASRSVLEETEAKVAQESFDRLQTESDDQREAIGALMDLLEKTMTVDDASELSDQIDEKIREEVERLSAKLAEQAEAASALGERVDSNAADLMKQIEAVGREAEEEESRLEKLIEKGAAENLATADKITATVTGNEEAAAARSARRPHRLRG